MADCIFIGYILNISAYSFLVYKSKIPDIHVNMIIESGDVMFFEDVFPYKLEENNAYEKRTHEIALRDEGPNEQTIDAEVKSRKSKRSKISKFFGSNFIAYALESKLLTFKETIFTPEAQMSKEAVNNEKESILSDHI